MIWVEVIYVFVCLLMAGYDAGQKAKGNYSGIRHGINGATHIVTAILCSIFFVWWAGFIILCEARIIFNTALNFLSTPRLPIDYVTHEKRPRALLDRIEKMIFGMNGLLPLMIYLVLFISLNIIWLIKY